MRIKILAILPFFVFILWNSAAQTTADIVPQSLGKQLFAEGMVNNTAEISKSGSIKLLLLPRHPQSAAISAELEKEKPAFALEALMFFPSGQKLPTLYTILRSAGSMQGITYYSNSKKTTRVLYEESWLVQDPNSKKLIPDQVFNAVPATTEYWMWQKDATLGGILYQVSMLSGADWIYSAAYNLTTVTYGIVPMIGEKKLNLRYLLIKTQDGILLYAVMSAKPIAFPGISERYLSSLRNRINAVHSWFGSQLAKQQ